MEKTRRTNCEYYHNIFLYWKQDKSFFCHPLYWLFLEILSLVFSDFLHKRFNNAQNVTESDFGESFFPAENARDMPEIDVFADFQWIFSIYFFVFFTKRHDWLITIPMIKPKLIFNNNWFLHPKLSKNHYSTPSLINNWY